MVKFIETDLYIELYFDSIPSDVTRELLKLYNWKWFGKKKCWSNINNAENIQFAKNLCSELNPIVKKESRLLSLERKELDMYDVVVRQNSFYCSLNHNLEDIAGEVDVCDKWGDIYSCLIPISYCIDCGIYYILEDTYKELKKRGIIMCQVMTYKDFKSYGAYSDSNVFWKQHSPLWIMGYTVNQNDDLSDAQRQAILSKIMDNKIMSKDNILSYISFFKKNHQKDTNAIEKWNKDYQFVSGYRLNTLKEVKVKKFVVYDRT